MEMEIILLKVEDWSKEKKIGSIWLMILCYIFAIGERDYLIDGFLVSQMIMTCKLYLFS